MTWATIEIIIAVAWSMFTFGLIFVLMAIPSKPMNPKAMAALKRAIALGLPQHQRPGGAGLDLSKGDDQTSIIKFGPVNQNSAPPVNPLNAQWSPPLIKPLNFPIVQTAPFSVRDLANLISIFSAVRYGKTATVAQILHLQNGGPHGHRRTHPPGDDRAPENPAAGRAFLAASKIAREGAGISPGERIGWRAWRCWPTPDVAMIPPALMSLVISKLWYPGQVIEATTEHKLDLDNYIDVEGIYSFNSLDGLLADLCLTGHTSPIVAGSIEHWGEAIEHRKGTRSQFARIRSLDFALMPGHLHGCLLKYDEREFLESIRDHYKVGPDPRSEVIERLARRQKVVDTWTRHRKEIILRRERDYEFGAEPWRYAARYRTCDLPPSWAWPVEGVVADQPVPIDEYKFHFEAEPEQDIVNVTCDGILVERIRSRDLY